MSDNNYNNSNTLYQRIVRVQTHQPGRRPIYSVPARCSTGSQTWYVLMEDIYRELKQPYDVALFFDSFGTMPVPVNENSFEGGHVHFYPDRFLYYSEAFNNTNNNNSNQYPVGQTCTCSQCVTPAPSQTYLPQRRIEFQAAQQQQQQKQQYLNQSLGPASSNPNYHYSGNLPHGVSYQGHGHSTAYEHSNQVHRQSSGDRVRAALDDLVHLVTYNADKIVARLIAIRDGTCDDDRSLASLEEVNSHSDQERQGSAKSGTTSSGSGSGSGSPRSPRDYVDQLSEDDGVLRSPSPSARFYARRDPRPHSPSPDH
ncbi:hypothetical protein K457DRAFT_901494 [Linnemannia elongata AG-77]|uniref:Uncharacterized protein n=1 Tax=Linnemannia elongata AG-77 TaxID=1314771 RepID=A0A197JL13_9FUNG|nr:hypothetical protein K457DRAFT_901494 [Linnemannia elongata AG-77]